MRRTAFVIAVIAVLAAVGAVPSVALARAAAPAAPHASPGSVGGSYPASILTTSAAPGSTWKPEPATYTGAAVEMVDQKVTARDGTVLSADVYYPSKDGKTRAVGPFPVIMSMTPYGKETGGALTYLVQRGYIDVVADVRGTGDSGGSWGLFDPVQATDGVSLVDWASKLPGSSGKVGLYGPSYLGIDQLFTAAAEPKDSPLKAIFPVVAATDVYRDTAFMGGLLDSEFDAVYLGLTGGLNTLNPFITALTDTASTGSLLATTLAHLQGLVDYHALFTADVMTNGDDAYDRTYWQQRSPQAVLSKIVANGIPAYLVGGEYDLFQRGEVDNYGLFQNLYAGRAPLTPITPAVSTTGRYQLLVGPWTHIVASATDFSALQLRWYDQWLKGEDTGVATTPTPVHAYDLGSAQWTEGRSYDVGTPTRLYFGGGSGAVPLVANHGTLSTQKPSAATGSDTELFTGEGGVCSRSLDQWGAGLVQTGQYALGIGALPCTQDDALSQVGPQVLTYTTQPLTRAAQIVGSSAVTVFATSTAKDTEMVAELEDVAPDGTSTPLTEGALLGSYRALSAGSVKASDGQLIRPDHPYDTTVPVVPGQLTRYDVEIFPTLATIAAGHAIRLTLSTADAGHLTANPVQLANLVGGSYAIQRTSVAPSALQLRLVGVTPSTIPAPPAVAPGAGSTPRAAGSADGSLATTGGSPLLPLAALVLVGAGAAGWRARRR